MQVGGVISIKRGERLHIYHIWRRELRGKNSITSWTTNGNQNASDTKISSLANRLCIHMQISVYRERCCETRGRIWKVLLSCRQYHNNDSIMAL